MRGGFCSGGLLLLLLIAPAGAAGTERADRLAFEVPPGMAPAAIAGDETFQGGFTCRSDAGENSAGTTACRSWISPVLPLFVFRLAWHVDPLTAERVVTGIWIGRDGVSEPLQEMSGLELRMATPVENAGFELIDMDFDGHLDMRIVAAGTAGPNVLYRNWLWSVDEERFVDSAALDEIVSPEFDPETREIVSRWRSSAAEGGVDVYAWNDGVPVIVHREVDRFDGPARCIRTFYDRIDEELRETGTGSCG